MTKSSVSKSANKAARLAEIDVAQKSGEAWAKRFINKYRSAPDDFDLLGWVSDAESLFKGDAVERSAFYETLQKAMLGLGGVNQRNIVAPDVIEELGVLIDQSLGVACLLNCDGTVDEVPRNAAGAMISCLMAAKKILVEAGAAHRSARA